MILSLADSILQASVSSFRAFSPSSICQECGKNPCALSARGNRRKFCHDCIDQKDARQAARKKNDVRPPRKAEVRGCANAERSTEN